jgi:hypothetical protein
MIVCGQYSIATRETWPMSQLIADMDTLEAEYGTVVGNMNTDGL